MLTNNKVKKKEFFIKEETKAKEILSLMRDNNLTLSLCESCTGGLLADSFVSVSGASDVFLGSLVCYNSKAKVDLAKVDFNVAYENFGVNEECSKQLALGALNNFNSNYAISTTGFAESKKDIFISIAKENRILTYKNSFLGDRNYIRQSQVEFILSKFLEILKKDYV